MTIRIAFTGAGYIADIHARAVQAQEEAEMVAVVEKYSDKAQAFAKKFGLQCCYRSVDELLDTGVLRPGQDALIVCTPNYLHALQAMAALERGVHVMVEKPMAMNAAEAEQMIAANRISGAALMVAHCWRFDEEVVWLTERLDKIGQVIRTKGYGVHVNWGPGGWFTQKELAGGGALADMGIHALDTARFLLGDPQPASVYARIGTHYGAYAVDDTGLIMVNWANGATSYIESGWWQPHADGPEAATQLYGTAGFASLFPTHIERPKAARPSPDQAGPVEVIDPGFVFPRSEHCAQSMYDAQMAYFLDCIRTGKTPVPGGAEGLVNMKVVDAAYESARTGQVVNLA